MDATGSEAILFDVIPPPLAHDRMTFIQTQAHAGVSKSPTELSFDTSVPIKVYLGFRSDQAVPAWVTENHAFAPTPHVIMTRGASHFHLVYVIYESVGLYVPGMAAKVSVCFRCGFLLRVCLVCSGFHGRKRSRV